MKEKFKRLNIAFKVPGDVAKYCIELSKELSKYGDTHFVLDGTNYFPHITIYSPEFPISNINNLYKKLEMIKADSISFKFCQKVAGEGYVGVEFSSSKSIKDLHKKIVNMANPLREGHIIAKYKRSNYLCKCTNKQIRYINEYGYPRVMDLYKPHLSILRFKDEDLAKKVLKKLIIDIDEFEINELGVYEMGKHGTCVKLCKSHKLKN